MATLPSASVTIDDEAGAFAGNTGYAVVLGCVTTSADSVPRVFASSKSLLDQHGYSQAADYAALHIEATKKPIIFVGMPIVTVGAVVRPSRYGTGTSVISAAATSTGSIVEEVDALLTVVTGGTIAAAGIVLSLTLDGGITSKTIRLGTAASYVVPYTGITISFAAGTLVAGDTFRFQTTAPLWDSTGLTAARVALGAQLKLARSFVVIGDVATDTVAGYVTTEVNAYETTNDRFTYARVNTVDRLPKPYMTRTLTGVQLTFADAGATATIVRDVGSFVTDGFVIGDTVEINTPLNSGVTGVLTGVAALTLTFGATPNLAAEVTTASTNTIEVTETMAAWMARMDTEFAPVASQNRIDIGVGRLRKLSPITGWQYRRPVMWAASIREYQHDLHIPTWRKSDGPLDGWSMLDDDGMIVEFDERVNGGGLAAGFTVARSWGNGPNGAFIALSLTRGVEGSLLSRTHNMAVANLACTVCHAATENAIGMVLELDDDGHATSASLGIIEEAINTDLEIALLQNKGEGARASKAVWRAATDDVLNIPGATLTGVLDLHLNGTLEQISTTVKIDTAG